MTRRLIVIGGDAAGMSAAAQGRRMAAADALEILAFERGPLTSYAACGLPYLIGGLVESPDQLVARTPEQHRANRIDVRICHEVMAIDVRACAVTVRDLDNGQETVMHCDELLIATGASGIVPPWPDIDAKGLLQLRTLDDAAEVERHISGRHGLVLRATVLARLGPGAAGGRQGGGQALRRWACWLRRPNAQYPAKVPTPYGPRSSASTLGSRSK